MSKEQQQQLLDFIGNFVALQHEEGHTRDCAEDGVKAAVACLFGAIWEVKPNTPQADAIGEFTGAVIETALTKFYGGASVGLQA